MPGAAQRLLQPHLDRLHHENLHFGMAHRGQQDKEWANQSTLDSLEADRREAMLRPGDLNLLQKLAERSDAEWTKIGQRDGLPNDLVLRNADQAKGELFGRVILTQLEKGDKAGAQRTWEFSQQHVDPQTITDAMRNRVIPGQEQAYDNGSSRLHENGGGGHFLQMNGGGKGQKLAQIPTPGDIEIAPSRVKPDQVHPLSPPGTEGRPRSIIADPNSIEGQANSIPTDQKGQLPSRAGRPTTYPIDPPPNQSGLPDRTSTPAKEAETPDEVKIPARFLVPGETDRTINPETIGDRPVSRDQMYKVFDFDPDGHGQWHYLAWDKVNAARGNHWASQAEQTIRDLIAQGRLRKIDAAHNNEHDAIKHALWNFLMAKDWQVGAIRAKKFADSHEVSAPGPDGETLMDLYNNRIGRLLALDPKNANRDPVEVILEAYQNGLLKTSPFKTR